MQQITVILTSVDGVVTRQTVMRPEGKPVQLNVPAGTKVNVHVQGAGQGKQPSVGVKNDLKLKQVGQNLVIEGEGEALVEVVDFYATPNASVGGVSWDYAESGVGEVFQSVEGKAAAEAGASMNGGALAEGGVGLSLPVGAGVLGVAALATGSASAPAVVSSNVVSGVVVAGPVVVGNNLVVKLYKADGSALLVDGNPAQGIVDANGKYSIDVGTYVGPVVVQLVGRGGNADYRDEATGLNVDLTIDLTAIGVVGVGGVVININPLAAMAAKLAGITSSAGVLSGAYDAAKAATANADIAKAFGLSGDVTQLDSTPVIKADGAVNAAASDLGKMLAALSGLDKLNGGMAATINSFVNSAGTLTTTTLKEDIIRGAFIAGIQIGADAGSSVALVQAVSTVLNVSDSKQGYGINSIAGDDVIDATDVAFSAASTIAFKVPTTVTTASAATDLEVWLPIGASAALAKGGGAIAVANGVATYTFSSADATAINALADGSVRFQIKSTGVNAAVLSERMVMVDKIDAAATGITLVNQVANLDENTSTTGGKKVADIVVIDPDGGVAPVLGDFAIGNTANFEIKQNNTTNKFELWLKSGAALNYEDPSLTGHGLTTTVTLGGTAARTYTLAITNVNEAPTVGGTGGANIAAQTAVINQSAWALDLSRYFTDVDAGDVLTYSITSGTLPAGLTLANGIISGTPTAVTASTLQFTVKATDKAGLNVSQNFSLDVVSAPVVKSFTVTDGTASNGASLGKSGEALTFVVTLSEAVTTTGTLTAEFTVGGTDVTATASAVTGSNTITFTGGTVPAAVDGTFTLKSLTSAAAITGDTSRQPLVAPTAGAIGYAGYTVDSTVPTVSSVVIASATGIQNNTLNVGDVVTVTVGFTEAVTVTGTPQLALNIGGTTVQASFASGSGTNTLSFTYTIAAGDTDANGISVAANALSLNSGTIRDAAGNNATLTHTAVADNASYLVDTAAPSATLTAGSGANTGDAVVQSSEVGTAYLVKTGGNTPVTVTDLASITGAADAKWNSVAITTAGTNTNLSLAGLEDGTYSLYTADAAGNLSAVAGTTYTVDSTVPTVSSVVIASATGIQNNTLNVGDVVTVTATFSEAVTVTGTPQLALNIGGTTVQASFASGSGTNTLSFTYTIAAGQTDANGISVAANALSLNGATIKDAAGNNATLTHTAVADNASYLVDTAAPSATLTAGSGANTGDAVVQSSEVGTAYLVKTGGNTPVTVTDLASITGAADAKWNSVAITTAGTNTNLSLAGLEDGTYSLYTADAAGNLSAVAGTTYTVDSTVPTVSSVVIASATGIQNNTLNVGDVVTVTATFSEAVTVTGTPQLALNIGGTTVQASFASGSGTNTLSFTYTIAAGQTDANGISVAANALSLNGATIKDAAGNNATLTHTAVADNASYLVDTAAPSATLTAGSGANTGDAVVQSSEVGTAYLVKTGGNTPVTVTDLASITGAADAKWNSVAITTAGTNTNLSLAGLEDGTYSLYTADAAGNLSAVAGTTYTVDSTVPTVSSVVIASATGIQNNTLNVGDVVTVTATFSEAVTVTGTPQLALNIGGTTVQASFASGSGTNTLSFTYTIAAGQTDANGISVAANALSLNGATIKDAAGNNATLTHTAVADNASYLVDTAAPSATLTAGSGANTGDAVVQSSEVGTAYLVKTGGNTPVTVTDLASITGAADAKWNSVAITTAGTNTNLSLAGLEDGTYSLYTADAAGNLSAVAGTTYTVDNGTPSITSISFASATGIQNSTLNVGDVVTVTVGFTEAVNVTGGTPELALNIGGTTVQASYASGSGSNTLSFTYTIAAGQTDANGISVAANALSLNSGTIRDAAGNNATLTHTAVADNASYLVDTAAPSATLTAGSGANTGDAVVQSSEVGTAYLVKTGGNTPVTVTDLASITGAADAKWNSVAITTAGTNTNLSLAGLEDGTYSLYTADAAGNLSAVAGTTYTVDSTVPTVSSVVIASATGIQNNTLNVGDVVTVTATFSEAVTVTGTPQLALNIGGTTVQASFASGSGTNTLSFTYTIAAGQTDANGISVAANALSLNSGTIRDAAGNNATLTHTAVADNASYLVDTAAPSATLTAGSGANTGDAVVQSSEVGTAYLVKTGGNTPVTVTDLASITGAADAKWNSVAITTAGTNTNLSLAGLEDGTYSLYTADAAGNLSAVAGTTYTVDNGTPSITSISFASATGIQNSTLNVGDVVTVTVGFTEAVNVTGGTPELALNIGGTTVQASYASGSGSNTLSFTYTIAAGQTDANGISVAANALSLNSGTIRDAAGNNATLTHTAVADNASYLVDTAAPSATLTAGSGANTGDAVVQSSEVGTAYLVKTGGNTPVTVTDLASITGAADAKWNSVAITTAGTNTNLSLAGLEDGTYSLYTADAAGNLSAVAGTTYTVDNGTPSITSISFASATGIQNSTLNVGDVVTVTVGFTEAVNVTGGTPELALNIGGTTVQASYASGSGSNTLSFTYTIAAGQTDANGISVAANALSLNSGTIRDAAGNNATLTHTAVADNASYLVDTAAPSATLTAGSGANTGNAVVQSSEVGTAYLVKTGGNTPVTVTDLASITGAADAKWNSVAITTAGTNTNLSLAGLEDGTYSLYTADAAGNLSAVAGTTYTVDSTVPTVSSVVIASATGIQNNTLNVGDVVTVTVGFTEAVTVTGTPQLALNIGGTTVQASFASGSGTNTLSFTYTIAAGQTDANGISVAANALSLNGATIKDAAGNNATLTHTAVADNASYLVDTAAPSATLTAGSGANTGDAVVQSSEVGTAYLVKTGGNTPVTVTDLASITGAADAKWNSVAITTAGTNTNLSLAGLEDGTYSLYTADAAGNLSAVAGTTYTVDSTVPTVSSVVIASATGIQNNTLNVGDVVTVTATFSEAVTVTGTPQLALNIGGTTVQASFASGSGTNTLSFTYTIAAGQTDANGISVAANALSLNGATIKDAAGNNATLTHTAVADNASYLVDTAAPSATLTAGSGANTGDAVVQSSEVGTAYLVKTGGNTPVTVTDLASITGAADAKWNSVAITTAGTNTNLSLAGLEDGTYSLYTADAAGNLSAVAGTTYTVDSTVPTVSSVVIASATGIQNNTLNVGDVVTVTATFSEAVTVTGTPQLALNIGGTTVQASFASGSGTNTLSFTYTIAAGQTDANGISVAANALSLNSGTIRDAAGNNATLTHTAVADNASYLVDTAAPSATLTAGSGANTGDAVVQSSEVGTAYLVKTGGNTPVTVTDLASITGAADAKWNSVAITTAGTNTNLSLAGLEDGTYSLYTADAAGNLSAVAGTTYTVDNGTPSITSISFASATGIQNSTLNVGDVVTVTVGFTEAVNVTGGTPELALNIGGTTVQASYASGSGSNTLSFTYTIAAGQTDANGISVAANALSLNSGTIRDAAGNNATLTHTAVADNASYLVDTAAPSATLTAGSGANTGNAVVQSSEVGTAYLVKTGGNTPVTVTDLASITGAADAKWNSVAITTAGTNTNLSLAGLEDGTYSLYTADAAGNLSAVAGTTYTVDNGTPSITSISFASATGIQNSTLNVGDVVTVTVGFTEAVNVTGGTPELALNIGGTTVQASYASGSGSNTLSFTYTIAAGQTDANGISVAANALSLNSGTIRDAAGNNATLTHTAVADNASYLVDTAAPSATLTAGSGANTGNAVVQSSEVGTAYLVKTGGNTPVTVTDLASITGAADAKWNSVAITTAGTNTNLSLAGLEDGTYSLYTADAAGNLSAVAGTTYTVDSTVPTVSSVVIASATGIQNNTLNVGDVVTVTVGFTEAVTVTGTPQLALNIGGTTVQASFASGSGTNTLSFTYTIAAGQTDANGISVAANALSLNGATIKDAAGNNATLTHTAVADNASYLVDTAAPSATLTAGSGANTGDAVVQSSEVGTAYLVKTGGNTPVTVTDLASITGAADAKWNSVAITTAGTNTNLSLAGLEDGTYSLYTADAAGNLSAVAGTTYTVDSTVPTVSSVVIASATGIQNNTLNVGDVVTVTVGFTEAVTVTGTPQLALNIGGTTVQASFASGSGTNTLSFTYTIAAGQTDANGISVAANALSLNSGTIRDAAGNNATLTHTAVADNASYLVDTAAPSATLTAGSGANTGDAVVQSSEVGTAYLVKTGGNTPVTVTDLASITGAADAKWNSVAITTAGTNTNLSLAGLEDGTYSLYTADAAGNLSAVAGTTYTVDSTVPTVSSVVIASATGIQNNTLNVGDVVTVTATFSEAVTVTGTPQLALNIGGTTVQASFASGSGTNTLSFTYTIAAGQTDANGISVAANALSLNSGTIRDAAGNNATLTHTAVADNASYLVDTAAPSATLTAGSGANTGDAVVQSSEVGTAYLVKTGGNTPVTVTDLASITGAADAKWNSVAITTAGTNTNLSLAGLEDGTYSLYTADAAGNLSAVAGTTYTVDSTVPTVSSVVIASATGIQNNTLNVGDVVTVTATFSEAVTVTGTPQLALNIGGTTVQASFASGSGTNTLSFTYTIAAGQTDANGISVAANALSLNGATIKDAAGNNATLTHTAVADNASYLVDTAAPSATLTAGSGANTGDAVVQSSEVGTAYLVKTGGNTPVTVTDLASITGAADAKWNSVAITTAGTNTNLSLAGLEDGTYSLYTADAAGNLSAVAGTTYTVDSTVPTVSSVVIASATGIQNNTLNVGDVVTVTATFSEAVTVTGTPQLALNIGGTTVQASFASGSGTNTLSFTYTIAAGQTDANGISVAANALSLNGATIKDAAGNNATLTHTAVADNASYLVDTAAPSATLTAGSGANTGDAVVQSSEVGTAYLVKTGGNTPVTVTDLASITGAADAKWNSVAITTAGTNTNLSLAGLEDGTYSLYTADAAGNLSAVAGTTYTVDSTVPTVSSVVIASATGIQNNTLNVGDVVTVTVGFTEAVTVTGTPQLALNIGGTTVQASFASGSGTNTLSFTYTIAAGQTDANGISVAANALSLNSGTIRDAAGNNATLTHTAVADNASYLVDTAAPSATLTAGSGANTGDAVVQSSEVGTAYLVKTGGNTPVTVTDLASITGAADAKWNSVAITTAGTNTNLSLAGLEDGTYSLYTADAAGNLSAVAGTTYTVDSTVPTVSSVVIASATGIQNSTLNVGDVVTVTVGFTEAVTVTGTPQLTLNIGGMKERASFASGSGTNTLSFTYTIAGGDKDANGISVAANALSLNSGTIRDAAGNNATLTHAAVADNASFLVDTAEPSATLTAGSGANTGDAVVQSSEVGTAYLVKTGGNTPVTVTDLASITGAADAKWNSVAITTAGTNTNLSLAGLEDGTYSLYTADAAGNLSAVAGTTYTVDSTVPTVSSVVIASATGIQNNTLNVGDVVTVTVGFTEAVTVTGTPQLALNIGGKTVKAHYASSAGANTLNFTYTVGSGGRYLLVMRDPSAQANLIDLDEVEVFSGGLNVALNKTTTSSPFVLPGSGAVDGIKGDAVAKFHSTDGNAGHWLMVDLGETYSVDSVKLTSAFADRALGLTTFLFDSVPAGFTDGQLASNDATSYAALKGTSNAYAVSGSGTEVTLNASSFNVNLNDTNGISIDANSLGLNSGAIKDAAGNDATLTHAAVADNAGYLVDTSAPTVSSVAVTSATGIQNNTLNVGDVVTVTVGFTEAVTVTGTPQLALNIGGTTVQASYASGNASNTLSFTYTIAAGQTDANGISIDADALSLNGATIKDMAGNNATLTHTAIADNAGFLVDTAAPSATLNSKAYWDDTSYQSVTSGVIDGNVTNNGDKVFVQSSEVGTAYLVRDGSITSAADIATLADSKYNSVSIGSAGVDVELSTTGLEAGTYTLYTADAAGNYNASANKVNVVNGYTFQNLVDQASGKSGSNLIGGFTVSGQSNSALDGVYYQLDLNGNGVGDVGDLTYQNWLLSGPSVLNDVTESNRAWSLGIAGYSALLATRDELLAVDAVAINPDGSRAVPNGWISGNYHSSTQSSNGVDYHDIVGVNNGATSPNVYDGTNQLFAFKVVPA